MIFKIQGVEFQFNIIKNFLLLGTNTKMEVNTLNIMCVLLIDMYKYGLINALVDITAGIEFFPLFCFLFFNFGFKILWLLDYKYVIFRSYFKCIWVIKMVII